MKPLGRSRSRDLFLDPGIRLRRVKTARHTDFTSKELPRLLIQVVLARRQPRIALLNQQQLLAPETVADDFSKLQRVTTLQLRLRFPFSLQPDLAARFTTDAKRLLHPTDTGLAHRRSQPLARSRDRQHHRKTIREPENNDVLLHPKNQPTLANRDEPHPITGVDHRVAHRQLHTTKVAAAPQRAGCGQATFTLAPATCVGRRGRPRWRRAAVADRRSAV